MHDLDVDGFAFETGTGAVGRSSYQDEATEVLAEVERYGLTMSEAQQACVSVLGPTVISAPDVKSLAAMVKPPTFKKLIAPHIAARKPARIVLRKNMPMVAAQIAARHVPALKAIDEFGEVYDFGEAADGSVPGVNADITPDGAVPVKAKAAAMANGWPPPAAYRPGNWDFEQSMYSLAFGDTLSGLSITYLGTPQRWKEIWNANDQNWRWTHNPDKLMAGEKIRMPLEARDMAKAMLADKSANPMPSTIGKKAPIPVAGENPNAPTVAGGTVAAVEAKGKKNLPLLIGGGVAAAGAAYFLLK